LKELRREFDRAVFTGKYIRDEHRRKVTTPEARDREKAIAVVAVAGIGEFEPFNERPRPPSSLSEEQSQAVTKILQSRDFITLFQGGAGTGKSYTLRDVVRGLKEKGHQAVVVAPQHQQAEDLRRDGLGPQPRRMVWLDVHDPLHLHLGHPWFDVDDAGFQMDVLCRELANLPIFHVGPNAHE